MFWCLSTVSSEIFRLMLYRFSCEELYVWKMTYTGKLRSLKWFLVEQNIQGNICTGIFFSNIYAHISKYMCVQLILE